MCDKKTAASYNYMLNCCSRGTDKCTCTTADYDVTIHRDAIAKTIRHLRLAIAIGHQSRSMFARTNGTRARVILKHITVPICDLLLVAYILLFKTMLCSTCVW